ncbi:MAG: enoyl-CoA hydratase, partial [Rhodomicrobium sp.]|nr:enoyl-CoA hydratase [Rhodomicrobium sp.]
MDNDILIRRHEAISEIRFNRPAKKNALTNAMYAAIADAIGEAENDASVRAILIGAEGDMFSAGNDIADFAAFASGGRTARWRRCCGFSKPLRP